MRALPIIFSAPMVIALLDGRKTQTRRLAYSLTKDEFNEDTGVFERTPTAWQRVEPGDLLWVRERFHQTTDGGVRLLGYDELAAAAPPMQRRDVPGVGPVEFYALHLGGWGGRTSRNFPSIHMPRWASRLTLRVTAVKVERLQEISEAEAEAEGVETDVFDMAPAARDYSAPNRWFIHWGTLTPEEGYVDLDQLYRSSFRSLWNSLHGADAWDANPEVVAISFTVEKRNVDQVLKGTA